MPANPLSAERQAQIAAIVENIKLSTGLFYPENSLAEIIEATVANVHITEDDFQGDTTIRGAIFREGDAYEQAIIAINSKQSPQAKTFALAHEFAHYMLKHDGAAQYYIDDKPFDGSEIMQKEGEANFFASVLLMPKNTFMKLDAPFVTDLQLAERFGVTEGVIGVRRNWIQRNGY